MRFPETGGILASLLSVVLLTVSPQSQAGEFAPLFSIPRISEIDQRSVYSSLFTEHYDPEPEHNNDQNLLGFELEYGERHVMGLALFDNSFGQASQYLYLGRKYRAFGSDRWYFKLTAGLLHGYEEPYEDKIPFNDLGTAPAIIPGVGYRSERVFVEFAQLGLAAGMLIGGFRF